MMSPAERAALALERALGPSRVITDPELCAPYARDESETEAVTPPCVVRVDAGEQVARVLELCEGMGVPVVPRGKGTGRSGGAAAVVPSVVLDLTGLNRTIELDRRNLLAVVEPGVITAEFQRAVEAEGLFFPPDPQSAEWCCLGGNVAENAGGPRALKYGCTREWTLGLEAVLMGGATVKSGRRTVKGVTGYDTTATMVGSEGTLAVFTRLTLKLMALPPVVRALHVAFADVGAAGRAVTEVVARALVPRCMELLDGICCEVLREGGSGAVRGDAGALLVIECDGRHPAAVEAEVEAIGALCAAEGALEVLRADDAAEREALWAVRREMSRALRRRARYKLSEDVVVPRTELYALLERVREISDATGVVMPAYGHAGDGNLHVNLLWDDPRERPAVDRAIEALLRATLALGGTLTGEHGIGALKAPYLPWEQSRELIALQRRVKSAFDPKGLLNPGKIFPADGGAGHRGC